MSIKKKAVYKLTLVLAPIVFRMLTSLLFATCRITVEGEERRDRFRQSGLPFIAAFWHYSIIYIIALSAGHPWVCMVSASKDGEYISSILEKLGYKTVRGSTGGGGVRALKGMVKAMQEGRSAAIVADGSQGPARKAQPGAILLASKTGAPIMPVVWSADRYLIFKSWDRTVLPKPFSRMHLIYGEPMTVPEGISSEQLEQYRRKLETRMNDLYEQCWKRYGKSLHAEGERR